MDYSLLVGIHEKNRTNDKSENESDNIASGGAASGGNVTRGETSDSEDYDSGERWTYNTPPDSPRFVGLQYNEIIPEIDIYAIPSKEGKFFYENNFKNFFIEIKIKTFKDKDGFKILQQSAEF